ncbi:hypothetical protein [Arthrobacter caoxuetaonis]|uniref:Uncharacterized protein n=1 Tax=Arthrobacter caoxuetaonis TaxID=2886935 RepID=A0A9X1MIY9_9MICC|nr:hypothetical protein [Arthrobacter caoxuetaonis]MCC3299827.1 hypothetical protein [Arthrobacter caoxuetaonis]USQ59273.1 hypothetical protein NF551_16955 [Arthrobacter caoxuetaonis]
MKKLSTVLRSERGDLLVSALVGLLVVGIIMGATASFLLVAAKASVANNHDISRTILLNSTLADELPRAASYGTDPIEIHSRDGAAVSLWLEKDEAGDPSVLHAATARAGRPASSCSGPASSVRDCVMAQTPVRTVQALPTPVYKPVEATKSGSGYKATVPSGVEELGYVVKVATASGSSSITFSVGGKKATVEIPRDGAGYYYGRLLVKPGSAVSVKTSGPAKLAANDAVTFYEVPDGK